MKKLYTLLSIVLISATSQAQVVISQVYGAGGNTGATYTNDFVELFNRGNSSVTITGYSLQYASSTGTFNPSNVQTLPAITLLAGQYYLIQQSGGTNGVPLPATPDLIPTVADNGVILAMAGANGKIALVNGITAISGVTDSSVIDFVGFGTATTFEGTSATPAPSTTTSILRLSNGCTDTNNNGADFEAGVINPRNSSSPLNDCTLSTPSQNGIEGFSMYPNPLKGNTLNFSSNANAAKSVQIFDVLGKEVVRANTMNNAVNVANLNAGVYIVKVTEEGKTATRKLVVQ